jgi:hypothetical protein
MGRGSPVHVACAERKSQKLDRKELRRLGGHVVALSHPSTKNNSPTQLMRPARRVERKGLVSIR